MHWRGEELVLDTTNQVSAFRFCNYNLHPEKPVSQLDFVRNLVHQYLRQEKLITIPRLVSTDTNGHFLTSLIQGHYKYCKKLSSADGAILIC